MGMVNGSQILARALRKQGGMAASGPGTANLVTGVGNAWADAAPLLAVCVDLPYLIPR